VSGVIVVLTPWPVGKDPAASYKSQWSELGELGTLQTINDHPAWVLPGNAKAGSAQLDGGTSGVIDPSINTVEMSIGGIDIVIAGPQDEDGLLRMAAGTK